MEELNIKQKAIGSGILFPLEVTSKEGKSGVYPVLGDMNLIENNIQSLIYYPYGFRYRQEEYGTKLESYIEEPNTQALNFLIKAHISSTIGAYESRIILKRITSQQYQDWYLSRIHFQLSGTPLEAYTDMAINRNI